jgi:hypothetical protein
MTNTVGSYTGAQTSLAARVRGRILVVRDALSQHQVYFDTGEAG